MSFRIHKTDWLACETTQLEKKTAMGSAYQLLSAVLTIVILALMARQLGPREYGIIATLLPVIEFVKTLRSLGIGTAIVQSNSMDSKELDELFFIQILFSLLLTMFVVGMSFAFAVWFADERLKFVGIALGAVSLLESIGMIHDALLRRHSLFGHLNLIRSIAVLAGGVAGIAVAVLYQTYWAIVIQQLATAAIGLVGLLYCASWLPESFRVPFRVPSSLKFGAGLTVAQFFDYARRNADNLLIRQFHPTEMLGNYDRGYRVLLAPISMILGPIMSASLPALSRKAGDDSYQHFYFGVLGVAVALIFPIGCFAVFFPCEVVAVALGAKWPHVAPIIQAFSIAIFLLPIASSCSVNLVVFRKTKLAIGFSLANLIFALIGFAIAVRYGVLFVAWAYSISVLCTTMVFIPVCNRVGGIETVRFLRRLAPAFSSSLVAVVIIKVLSISLVGSKTTPTLLSSTIILLTSILLHMFFYLVLLNGQTELRKLISQVSNK